MYQEVSKTHYFLIEILFFIVSIIFIVILNKKEVNLPMTEIIYNFIDISINIVILINIEINIQNIIDVHSNYLTLMKSSKNPNSLEM